MSIDPEPLEARLREAFGGTDGQARVVARQAADLDDSGRYAADVGSELTNAVVLEELTDAPDGEPADRWNWWIGSLEIAYGGYERFGVQRYRR
ncbi:hypothetical protein [Natrononativus amylolyticus]|uniref:hypothetical protein n=1 Tax=Natrononativus amylolyticus TaxID=2963434 RepID=UPI0020CE2FEF|nr:hypothetical protein [Natrononativus amylolyticus]